MPMYSTAQPKIITSHDYPPIPIRKFDWSAHRDGTMDADYDYESGRYVSTTLIGRGATEAEAIADLLEQEADRA